MAVESRYLTHSQLVAQHQQCRVSISSVCGNSSFGRYHTRAIRTDKLSPLCDFAGGASGRGTVFRVASKLDGRSGTESELYRPNKTFDVVALSNLCVDVVVTVDQLPSSDMELRKQLLEHLTATPPPQKSWEVGGMTNFLIAAARLGMRTAAIGHTGDDIYGQFLGDILKSEGVQAMEPVATGLRSVEQNRTLLCFVLVAGSQHTFCSSYDFGPWPLLSFVNSLTPGVQALLKETEALFINGFVFDEIPSAVVVAAAEQARKAGAAVFFDPGPRAWTFLEGERRDALEAILDVSDVVLMTLDEATAITGKHDAEDAARLILSRHAARTEWCVVKKGAEGALLASKTKGEVYQQAALKVDVRDTVGCGDSFAAAVVLGYTRQHSIPAVMALANAVGAATAMGSGAGRNVASADLVMELLQGAVADCFDGRHLQAIGHLQAALSADYD